MSLLKRKAASEIRIRSFQPGDEAYFRSLNEEWITRYFRIEPKDESILANPKLSILDDGGQIFFAAVGELRVGCCALQRMSKDEFEVTKLAVTPASRGLGIGRKLLLAAIETGRNAGARRLYLETNHILTPAIRLYESVGFEHLPPERIKRSPYARGDVYMELWLV